MNLNHLCPKCQTTFYLPPDFAGEPVCPQCLWEQLDKEEPTHHKFDATLYFFLAVVFVVGVVTGYLLSHLP